ncbi:unnamed protein product [Acanthoscelides obtectus]|uniref:Transposase n=1 Tax=Acanthoscelides obtectus TaxID=200917 RepID=A0A9P0ME55_ACAOB|nr:unnamed protein product [Acanthoscelides obtectus]CAK1675708.1 hypothetical protein AOBTE_LOCUS30380 [Acanthoscelides obtectus]
MELNREHFRAIIYYNFQRQLTQQECLAELLYSTISRWYGEFKRGRLSLGDDPRVGAPKTAVTQENVDAVRKLIIEDRHVTYREIEASLKISKTSIIRSRSVRKRWSRHLCPLNEQRTITADWYTTICLPKVITELRKINRERRIILHQDNASSHTFFTFPKIKNRLREEAVDAFNNAVLDLPANEWNKCFEDWFERMQMCINGEYFENNKVI